MVRGKWKDGGESKERVRLPKVKRKGWNIKLILQKRKSKEKNTDYIKS